MDDVFPTRPSASSRAGSGLPACDALILTRAHVATLLSPADCLDAVASAFRACGRDAAHSPPPMHVGVAAVGADHSQKSEIAAGPMAGARVHVDVRGQCAAMGDPHHALAAGAMTVEDIRADLAELATGSRPGRGSADEITTFNSISFSNQPLETHDAHQSHHRLGRRHRPGAGDRRDAAGMA